MEYKVTFRDGLCEVVTFGDAELLKFREFLAESFGHEDWRPGIPVLHDHSDLNSGPLSMDDIARIADYCEEFKAEFGPSRVAVVLRRDLEFGLARMWAALVEGRWEATGGLFRDRDEALRWLMQEPSPDG